MTAISNNIQTNVYQVQNQKDITPNNQHSYNSKIVATNKSNHAGTCVGLGIAVISLLSGAILRSKNKFDFKDFVKSVSTIIACIGIIGGVTTDIARDSLSENNKTIGNVDKTNVGSVIGGICGGIIGLLSLKYFKNMMEGSLIGAIGCGLGSLVGKVSDTFSNTK